MGLCAKKCQDTPESSKHCYSSGLEEEREMGKWTGFRETPHAHLSGREGHMCLLPPTCQWHCEDKPDSYLLLPCSFIQGRWAPSLPPSSASHLTVEWGCGSARGLRGESVVCSWFIWHWMRHTHSLSLGKYVFTLWPWKSHSCLFALSLSVLSAVIQQ